MPGRILPSGFLAHPPLILALSLVLLSIPLTTTAHKTSPPTKNVTLTVPITLNITDHGDPHLLCTPTRWTDVASFFIGNFVAHAATVKTLPGEPALLAFAGKIYALLFPTSGLIRGLKGIYQHAIFCKTSLETASKAGALCTVVRLPNWNPRTGDTVKKSWVARREERRNGEPEEIAGLGDGALHGDNIELENHPENRIDAHHEPPADQIPLAPLLDSHGSIPVTWEFTAFRPRGEHASFLPSTDTSSIQGRKIHGTCCLPPGYGLTLLSPGTRIVGFDASGVPGRRPPPPPGSKESVCKELKNTYAALRRAYFLIATRRGTRGLGVREPVRAPGLPPPPRAEASVYEELENAYAALRRARSLIAPRRRTHGLGVREPVGAPDLPPPWWRRLAAAVMRWVYSGAYPPERRLPRHALPTRDPDTDFFVSDEVSSTYSFSKALVAIIQVIFASVTLYRARGDQIRRYGYAAFGLTVAPYLIMSVVNLISTMLTPDYPALYLVSSETMREAVRRGGSFEGVVGELGEGEGEEEEGMEGKLEFEVREDGEFFLRRVGDGGQVGDVGAHLEQGAQDAVRAPGLLPTESFRVSVPLYPDAARRAWKSRAFSLLIGSVYVGLLSLAIIGGLSQFKPGKSTKAQRVWTMSWLAFGIVVGPTSLVTDIDEDEEGELWGLWYHLFYSAPAIGGYVVVAQMLMSYGTCIRIY